MAKTQIVKLQRAKGPNWCLLDFENGSRRGFCWDAFKEFNPVICRNLRGGQTRKLKRTQLKKGFKLERT